MKKCVALLMAANALFLGGCCIAPRATRWEYKVVSPHLLRRRVPAQIVSGAPRPCVRLRKPFLTTWAGRDGYFLFQTGRPLGRPNQHMQDLWDLVWRKDLIELRSEHDDG